MDIIARAKDIYELAKKGATLELQEQVMDLRAEAMDLQEENLRLKARVAELEAQISISDQLEFDGSVYWKMGDGDKAQKDGPFCQKCFDVDMRLVRLQYHEVRVGQSLHRRWQCNACNSGYDAK